MTPEEAEATIARLRRDLENERIWRMTVEASRDAQAVARVAAETERDVAYYLGDYTGEDDQGAPPLPAPARKVGGSYQASGVVLATCTTRGGLVRVVFEFDTPRGLLHIFSPDQIVRRAPRKRRGRKP